MSLFYSSFKHLTLAAILAPAALISVGFLSGCGITPAGPSATMLSSVSGSIHGGQTPIQNATVTLYVTNSAATGYGQAGTRIGGATTDANGSFTIDTSATTANCPAGQQAYATSAGGYQTGQPTMVNNSVLLMAALGDCANVNANTHVIMNEVTTVAAAYALSGFMTTSTSAQLFVANVSAPPANSAAAGGPTAAAGLPHAFLNAASLADVVGGTARTQTANIAVGAVTVTGSVPAAEINTLGNILQSCVNGPTGNSSCVSLFGFTPSISGTAPTNTLQSMINLARNPYPSVAAMTAASGLFSLASPNPAFQPSITAQPPDWSLAIVYKGTPFVAQYEIALDANDTIYAGSNTGTTKIAGLSAYGLATPAFTSATTGTSSRQIAPDTLGNIWLTNNAGFLLQYSATAGGAPTQYTVSSATGTEAYGVAVDKASNVWVSNAAAVTPNIIEYQYSPGSTPAYAPNYTATAPGGFQPVEITIDANQNVWSADYFTNGNLASVLPNLSAATPASTPTYTTSGTTITPVSATFASGAIKPLGLVTDASGNAWYGITGAPSVTTTGIEEVIPTTTSSVISALAPQPLIANATLGAGATGFPGIDGSGVIFIPDNSGNGAVGIHAYSTVTVASSNTGGQILSSPAGYLGCYLATAATTVCGTGSSSAVSNPRVIAVDSTGSVWAGITGGGFTQLIGLGAPTWPLLSIGKPGLSPGSTTVTPLP